MDLLIAKANFIRQARNFFTGGHHLWTTSVNSDSTKIVNEPSLLLSDILKCFFKSLSKQKRVGEAVELRMREH